MDLLHSMMMTEEHYFFRKTHNYIVCMYIRAKLRINSIKSKNWRHLGGVCCLIFNWLPIYAHN